MFDEAVSFVLCAIGKEELKLKPEQLQAICHVHDGKDVLWLPTGFGKSVCSPTQGRRKLPKSGAAALLDQSGDAAKGCDIEGCKDNNSAQSAAKKFCLHFQLSGWALVALSYSSNYL